MKLQQAAEKELKRMEAVIGNVKTTEQGKELLELAESYLKDSRYFYEKKKFLEAFEAAVISWTYIDAGIHLKIFNVDKKLKNLFTI